MKLCLFLLAALLSAHYRHHGRYELPDARITPGHVDARAVADLSGHHHIVQGIERNVCAPDFATGPIRRTIRGFARMKLESCRAYGVARCDGSVEYDHLVSIELGGCPDCADNLWPQDMKQARVKDAHVENALHKLVCEGKMRLPAAQHCAATDWVACMNKIQK